MSNYREGRRFEDEVARQLREWGWIVWHLGKPIDLIAFRGNKQRIIETKSYYDLKTEDIEKLVKLCKKLPAISAIYLVHPLSTGEALIVVTVSAAGKERVEFFDEVFM